MSPKPPTCTDKDKTRERILLAAETLFAEQGYAATSVRAISAAAGVNLAAAHYHFGSKQGLLNAVVHGRVAPINTCRLQALTALESKHDDLKVDAIMAAFFAPFMSGELADGFPRIIARIFGEPDELIRPILEQEFLPVTTRFIAALQIALPGLDNRELHWRFHFVVGAMIHLVMFSQPLGSTEKTPDATKSKKSNSAAFQQLQTFVVAGLLDGQQPLNRSS
jgi:AcrR family transcriptional regulator